MGLLFLNGPVQNGDFTFAREPGKAVGMRIAEALNGILGTPAVPHLWNTVTLAGDLRYQRLVTAAGRTPASRTDFEASVIAAKYDAGRGASAGIATDADSAVADLATEMIMRRLADGSLTISRETVRECSRCGHMTGTGQHSCKACGHEISHARTAAHLVAVRGAGQPALDLAHIYAHHRRPPLHLRDIAANTPPRLILSRTRDYGIDLGRVGLPGLVLDPRAGVHIAVLAVAARFRADVAVMTTTQNAAANVAAYGHHFADHDGLRLLYALHGRVPYHHLAQDAYHAYGIGGKARAVFEDWFLPLFSLKEKNGVQASQIPALLRYFRRAFQAATQESGHDHLLESIRQSIRDGNTDWVMRKAALAAAMSVS